jgi:hypothetical protein
MATDVKRPVASLFAGPTAERKARDAALSEALSPGVLRDLIRLIRSYDVRAPHRWKLVPPPERPLSEVGANVSIDGRALTLSRGGGRGRASAVSTRTLGDGSAGDAAAGAGALRWCVRVPRAVQCWIGVVDTRTLHKAYPSEAYVGDFLLAGALLCANVSDRTAFRIAGGDAAAVRFTLNRKSDTVLHFEFDPIGCSLAVGMVQGECVQPMRTVFEIAADPMFVAPYLTVQQPVKGRLPRAVELTIESEEE